MATQKKKPVETNWGLGTVVFGTAAAATSTAGQSFPYTQVSTTPPPLVRKAAAGTERKMTVTQHLLDARLEAVEARTETKFAQLVGKLDAIGVSIGHLSERVGELKTGLASVESKAGSAKTIVITTVVASALGIVALVYTLVAYGQAAMSTTADAYAAGAAAVQTRPATEAPQPPAPRQK